MNYIVTYTERDNHWYDEYNVDWTL